MSNTTKAIAHDLKTPLSRAQIVLHQALDACENADDPAPFIQQALDENTRLNGIFETMLRISRLQMQPLDKAACREFVVAEMLGEVVAFLQPNAEANGQNLRVDCDSGLLASADREMLQQAMINLVNNAILYAGNDVTIVV